MAKNISNLNDSLDNKYSPKTHTHTGMVTSVNYTDGTSINIDGADYGTQIGTLNSLQTSNKDNLVAAINEVFQSGVNAKQQLVDALNAKGTSCSTSDSWNTLINYINENSGGGLDIISATSLPATGKENQVCVVTDNVTDIFLITSKIEDITTDASKINIYIGTEDTSDSTLLSITNKNITTNYYFNKVCQGNDRLASYCYQNNTWKQLTKKNIPVYQNSSFPSASILGNSPIKTSSSTAYLDGESIFIGTSSSFCRGFTFSKAIDFSGYKKVTIVAYDKYGTSTLYVVAMLKHYTSIVDLGTNVPGSSYTSYRKSVTVGATSPTVYTFDISSWSGTYYFGIVANGNGSWLYINEIILE